jgi:endothelin-converting enzyme/putative endopeptidase
MQFAKAFLILAMSCAAAAQNGSVGIDAGDLDRSVDPCADFFQFANGTWRAKNPIPASMTRWSRRWQAGETTKDKLKDILDQAEQQTNAPRGSTEQLIGDYYGACMDQSKSNAAGIKPLQPWLDRIDAAANTAELQAVIAQMHDVAVVVPFSVSGSQDPHNPTMIMADVAANGFALPEREYYLGTEPRFKEAREKYQGHIARMFKLSGWDDAASGKGAETILAMETKFAEAALDPVSLRDPSATDHPMSVADLQKLTPQLRWSDYLGGLKPGFVLNVQEPKFMSEVERQMEQTPLADWKTYLRWHMLNAAAPYLSQDFAEEDWQFFGKYLNGATEMKPRWKLCVESTDQFLGEALGKKYVEKYFPPEAKVRMQEMVRNLLAAMKDDIETLDWMSAPTKQKALEKLATFNPKIGYPDKWKDYSSVTITRNSYFDDVIAGRRFLVADDRGTIGKPVDRGRWGITTPTSDAYYNPLLNEIVFPAGILQPPAFNMAAVDAVNYGAIGVVIGHEITHGFDDQGAQFDAQGRLNNWWTAEDLKKFQERGACVVDQFENYYIEPGIHHKGKLVEGESIGDLGGAKIAFRAYEKSLEGKPRPADIDGFTPEQQFFIAWGQFRGDEIRPEQQRTMVQADPHPIAKFRVNGPVSNMPAFQKAFQCKPDSPMVRPPDKRCEVW